MGLTGAVRARSHPEMRWLPNALTALRILLLPMLVVLLARVESPPGTWTASRVAAVALFFVIAITDWFDGYLARRFDAITRWGSMADAIADRLALLVPLLYLGIRDPAAFPAVPLWVPVWLAALALLTGAGWLVARRTAGARAPAAHNSAGRTGTWLLFALVLWAMVGLPAPGVVLLGAAGLVLATISAGLYVREWLTAP